MNTTPNLVNTVKMQSKSKENEPYTEEEYLALQPENLVGMVRIATYKNIIGRMIANVPSVQAR